MPIYIYIYSKKCTASFILPVQISEHLQRIRRHIDCYAVSARGARQRVRNIEEHTRRGTASSPWDDKRTTTLEKRP